MLLCHSDFVLSLSSSDRVCLRIAATLQATSVLFRNKQKQNKTKKQKQTHQEMISLRKCKAIHNSALEFNFHCDFPTQLSE